jgi:hypothetical protein
MGLTSVTKSTGLAAAIIAANAKPAPTPAAAGRFKKIILIN